MEKMIYISEHELKILEDRIKKLEECLKFAELLIKKYKKLAADCIARDARRKNIQK